MCQAMSGQVPPAKLPHFFLLKEKIQEKYTQRKNIIFAQKSWLQRITLEP